MITGHQFSLDHFFLPWGRFDHFGVVLTLGRFDCNYQIKSAPVSGMLVYTPVFHQDSKTSMSVYTLPETVISMANFSTEVQFAQNLASNEKKIRDKALKKLKKYLRLKSSSKGDSACRTSKQLGNYPYPS